MHLSPLLALFISTVTSTYTAANLGRRPTPSARNREDSGNVDWEAIKPSTSLEWHLCDDVFQCARLLVPLDWTNASDTRQAAIAIKKYPAAVNDTHPAFAGPILLNPGGPGFSGMSTASSAPGYSAIVDKPGERYYEWISFDPRGVGSSTPGADCMPNDTLSHAMYDRSVSQLYPLRDDATTINRLWEVERMLAETCKEREGGDDGDIFRHVGTASVARDMVEIVDKIAMSRGWEPPLNRTGQVGSPEEGEGMPRVNFIGYSYGTVIANYFASMFPGRVGRIIPDSVVDIDDYISGLERTTLLDLDEMVQHFFRGCHEAGPDVCDLAQKSDTSYKAIEERVSAMLKNLSNKSAVVHLADSDEWVGISDIGVKD